MRGSWTVSRKLALGFTVIVLAGSQRTSRSTSLSRRVQAA